MLPGLHQIVLCRFSLTRWLVFPLSSSFSAILKVGCILKNSKEVRTADTVQKDRSRGRSPSCLAGGGGEDVRRVSVVSQLFHYGRFSVAGEYFVLKGQHYNLLQTLTFSVLE